MGALPIESRRTCHVAGGAPPGSRSNKPPPLPPGRTCEVGETEAGNGILGGSSPNVGIGLKAYPFGLKAGEFAKERHGEAWGDSKTRKVLPKKTLFRAPCLSGAKGR